MDSRPDHAVALITGASKGIGAAIARALDTHAGGVRWDDRAVGEGGDNN